MIIKKAGRTLANQKIVQKRKDHIKKLIDFNLIQIKELNQQFEATIIDTKENIEDLLNFEIESEDPELEAMYLHNEAIEDADNYRRKRSLIQKNLTKYINQLNALNKEIESNKDIRL